MEDAKIGSEQVQNPFSYNKRFPTVLDSDDITFELGKLTIDKINNEKLLESLIKKNQEITQTLHDIKEKTNTTEARIKVLEESNILFTKNNETLDKEIVSLRGKLVEKEKSINTIPVLEAKLGKANEQLQMANNKINTVTSEVKVSEEKYNEVCAEFEVYQKKAQEKYKGKCAEFAEYKKSFKKKPVKKLIKKKVETTSKVKDGGEW
jgi:chromosome segregation ATPase